MIDQDIQNIINERYRELPRVIQKAITESGWEQKIRTISQQNGLAVGDAYTLEINTLLTLLGLIDPRKFKEVLLEEIRFLTEEKVNKILSDVDEQIFKEIKNDLITESEKNILDAETDPLKNIPEKILAGEKKAIHHQSLVAVSEQKNAVEQKKTEAEKFPENKRQIAEEMKEHVEIIDEDTNNFDFAKTVETKLTSSTEATKEVSVINIDKTPVSPETQNTKDTQATRQTIDPYRETVE